MTENELGTKTSLELERSKFRPNKTKPVAGPESTFRNSVTFAVLGTATGGGFVGIRAESEDLTITPGLGDDADTVAQDLATAIQAGLDAAYGAGQYTATDTPSTNPGVEPAFVTLTKLNGTELWLEDHASTDPTIDFGETNGTHFINAMLHEATAVGEGLPVRYESGFDIEADIPTSSRETVATIHVMLTNVSGAPATARWRLWWWFDYIGWVEDQEVGIRTVSGGPGLGITADTIAVSVAGAKKVAVELVDNGAGGAMPADTWVSAIGLIAN